MDTHVLFCARQNFIKETTSTALTTTVLTTTAAAAATKTSFIIIIIIIIIIISVLAAGHKVPLDYVCSYDDLLMAKTFCCVAFSESDVSKLKLLSVDDYKQLIQQPLQWPSAAAYKTEYGVELRRDRWGISR